MQLCGTFERIATGESHKFYTEIRTCMRSRARYQSHTWKECCTLRSSKFSNRALVLLSVTVLFIPMQKYENKSGHRCRNVRNITMDTPARYNCVSPVTELQLNVNSSSNSFSNTVSDKNSWDTSIARCSFIRLAVSSSSQCCSSESTNEILYTNIDRVRRQLSVPTILTEIVVLGLSNM